MEWSNLVMETIALILTCLVLPSADVFQCATQQRHRV